VVLEGLDDIEVRSLSLGDTILSVKLELSGDDGVLTPAVHVEGGLSEDEGTGIGHIRSSGGLRSREGTRSVPLVGGGRGDEGINSSGHLEDVSGDEGSLARGLGRAAEDVDGVGESIKSIGVVEGLSTEELVEGVSSLKGTAVVNVSIGLNNPDELLARVVEVDLDLVRRRSDRLITGVLELLNEVLMRVLGHLSALISIQEDEINVDRSSNKRLLVGSGNRLRSRGGSQRLNSPQALTNRSEVNVDLDLVVLESNQRKSKTRVSAKPEEERDVEGGLRKGIAGSANLAGAGGGRARTIDVSESGVSDVGKLSGVANHLVVSSLLLRRHCELIPDVHPVTILAVDSLTSNLDLNLSDQLLTGVIQPTSIDTGITRSLHLLVNLGESNLDIGAVSQISVSGDGAGHTATKVSLTVEGLLDGLHSEVGVASVRHLPVSDLGVSSKENILGAVGD